MDQVKNKEKDMMKDENSCSQLRALVVDDDSVSRMIHQQLLKKVGVKNYAAVKNGREALDLHCNGQRFDLILMDMDMPVMNGIEATKKLREMGIRCKIICVSSLSGKENGQEFKEAGLDAYYTKPLKVEMLSAILDTIKS